MEGKVAGGSLWSSDVSQCGKTITVKQGTMFSVNGRYHTSDSTPISLVGKAVHCELWFRGSLIAKLTTTMTDAAAGEYVISSDPVFTENWPVGELLCDIVYAPTAPGDGSIVATETFTVKVLPRITRNY